MNSKKIISILLTMSLATSLMACSNTETVESSAIVSETVVEDEPIEVILTEGDPYSISAMQDVDVFDLILGFSSVAPNESFTSYPERFAVAPMTSEWLDFADNVDGDRGYYEYAFNCADGDTDVISTVTLIDVGEDGDNIIFYDTSAVSVSFSTDNFTLASSVYESALEYLTDTTNGAVTDERNETEDDTFGGWYATVGDNQLMVISSGDVYFVTIQVPIVVAGVVASTTETEVLESVESEVLESEDA